MQIFHLKIILLLLKPAAQAQVGETTLLINYVRNPHKYLRRGNICVFKYILIYY